MLQWNKKEIPRTRRSGNDGGVIALLRYSNPYAQSAPLDASPATPHDFLDMDASEYAWMFAGQSVPFDWAEIETALRRDTASIPATVNWEGSFGDHHLACWISGYVEYRRLSALAAQYGVTKGAFFDFDGSTGRVFRHFDFQSDAWNVTTCDFKVSSVAWNLAHFGNTIRSFQGMYFPRLQIEVRSFDIIIALSVFKHIDETETGWLMELRRVMKPSGILIATVPLGRFVSTFRDDDAYRCNVVHSNDYFRAQWSRYFDVRDIVTEVSGAQSAVILQKAA